MRSYTYTKDGEPHAVNTRNITRIHTSGGTLIIHLMDDELEIEFANGAAAKKAFTAITDMMNGY